MFLRPGPVTVQLLFLLEAHLQLLAKRLRCLPSLPNQPWDRPTYLRLHHLHHQACPHQVLHRSHQVRDLQRHLLFHPSLLPLPWDLLTFLQSPQLTVHPLFLQELHLQVQANRLPCLLLHSLPWVLLIYPQLHLVSPQQLHLHTVRLSPQVKDLQYSHLQTHPLAQAGLRA
jgi:hypothetical protein